MGTEKWCYVPWFKGDSWASRKLSLEFILGAKAGLDRSKKIDACKAQLKSIRESIVLDLLVIDNGETPLLVAYDLLVWESWDLRLLSFHETAATARKR